MAATRAAREVIVNVSCPQCATVFRVDPAKVPERGVRARCSVCSGLIAVRRPDIAAPAVPGGSTAAAQGAAPAPPPSAPAISAPPTPPAAEIRVDPPLAPPLVSPVVPIAALPDEGPFATEHYAQTTPAPQLPTPAPAPSAPPAAPAHRPGNPFLQQDPATRARRLARALVSDLVVYHPEKRQRGLQDGNLKELFAEEIRKSWEEYTEQVGEEIASSTPYFTEALNEILAEGRTLFG
jgi:predicted Zn finger-like uncharacterized protein